MEDNQQKLSRINTLLESTTNEFWGVFHSKEKEDKVKRKELAHTLVALLTEKNKIEKLPRKDRRQLKMLKVLVRNKKIRAKVKADIERQIGVSNEEEMS